jgi:hypothetical protein
MIEAIRSGVLTEEPPNLRIFTRFLLEIPISFEQLITISRVEGKGECAVGREEGESG